MTTILQSLLLEDDKPPMLVVFGGRFQPMHPGHFGAYEWLVNKFGVDSVFIATSNKTSDEDVDSPLTFKDKKKFISAMFDIPSSKIVQCKNPAFAPVELTKHHPDSSLIIAVGEKDLERYQKSSYFKPLPRSLKNLKPASDEGYYIITPMQGNGISGTKVRKAIRLDDEDEAYRKFCSIYSTKNGAKNVATEIKKNVFDYLRSKML